MLVRALLIAALMVGGYFFVRWLRRSPWWGQRPPPLGLAGIAGFLLLILLTLRGGGEIAVPLLAVLVPFFLRWLKTRPSPSVPPSGTAGQNQSAIVTRFLRMTLDHATGVMSGVVQEGRFAGCELRDLDLRELLDLWRACRIDPQSVAVLETYLDRHADPAWRDRLEESERSGRPEDAATDPPSRMDRAEAYAILGLPVGASRAEIQAAYRRLIQRLHPDQGGSGYLAACLNWARDLLMVDLGQGKDDDISG